MKKIISTIMAICMIFALATTAFAADTKTVDPVASIVAPRAVSPPTSDAPWEWYGVYHYFSTSTFTWSAYIFFHGHLTVAASQPFSVEVFNPNGPSFGPFAATPTPSGLYYFNYDCPLIYYFRVICTGSPINNGFYNVTNPYA